VRNASAAPDNVTRVGVAFTELTRLEHDMLAAVVNNDTASAGPYARGTWVVVTTSDSLPAAG
jgi:hypothetical protein